MNFEFAEDDEGAVASDGTVPDKDDKPAAGATVVLMPEARLRSRHDLYGRFQFETVAPGDYQLLAWDDVEPGSGSTPSS